VHLNVILSLSAASTISTSVHDPHTAPLPLFGSHPEISVFAECARNSRAITTKMKRMEKIINSDPLSLIRDQFDLVLRVAFIHYSRSSTVSEFQLHGML
jgi:hypothetical protein